MESEAANKANELIQYLSAKEGKRLWAYENITPKNRRLQSSQDLGELLSKVVEVFSYEDPDLRQKWGETALKWATCCSVRHIACRSFQCFRTLMPAFNQHMLADMLARLSNTIADKSDEIRGFALEIILTLTDVTRSMNRSQIEQYPQIFWAAVACLYSPYEAEHAEALVLLEVVLDKFGFSSELANSFPKEWSSEFEGLQPLLLKGLQFESAEDKTFAILTSIMLDDNPPLIDPSETRLMYLLLGSICRLLHGLDSDNEPDKFALDLASKLSRLFEHYSLNDVARNLNTYPKQKGKFQQDYLKQLLGSIWDVFLFKYSRQALMFALLLVKNKQTFYREKGLMLVESLVPFVSGKHGRAPAPEAEGPIDIASLEPLLSLVQTNYADKALAILNMGIPVQDTTDDTNAVAAAPVLWGFGPAAVSVATETARHNVHAVVFECSSITPIEHNIQFSIEDFSLLTGEEASPATIEMERTEQDNIPTPGALAASTATAAAVVNGSGNAPFGEGLISALKDLDDFFNEDADAAAASASTTPSSSLSTSHRTTHTFE